jgi:transcriptional regulator with XRE-family HTH domain
MKKSIYSAEYAVLCQSLKTLRGRAGLTQRELAVRLKVSPSWVAKVEMGERRVDVVEFMRFVRACGGNVESVIREMAGAVGGRARRRVG